MTTVSFSGLTSKLKRVAALKAQVMPQAYQYFKSITPVKSGNARRNTRLNNKNDIEADYIYASFLDEGSSKQAPDGMTRPTEKVFKQLVKKEIKKIGK